MSLTEMLGTGPAQPVRTNVTAVGRKSLITPALLCAIACLALATGVRAQAVPIDPSLADVALNTSVLGRTHEGYDPIGFPVGLFQIYPAIGIQGIYDDNIYNDALKKEADEYVSISPKVTAQGDLSNIRIKLVGDGVIERYVNHSNEDNQRYEVTSEVSADVTRSLGLDMNGAYGRYIEPRGSLGDIYIGGSPIRYNLGKVDLSAHQQFGRIRLTVGGGFASYNYLDGSLDHQVVDQNYRDHNELAGSARVDFSLTPQIRAFVAGSLNKQSYDERFAGLDQNSHGYAVLSGLTFGLSELISGEIGIGYLSQGYVNPSFKTSGGLTYKAKIIWNPTTLLTATLAASKSLLQSPSLDSSGVFETDIKLTVDYELLRNLIITASGELVVDSYRNLDRRDGRHAEQVGLRYLFTRMIGANITFGHRQQSTDNNLGRSFSGTSISFGFSVQL